MEDLAGAEAMRSRSGVFDVFNRDWLVTPSVVDEEFGIDAENSVELVVASKRLAGELAHGVNAEPSKAAGVAGADAPKVSEGLVVPERAAVAGLV